MIIEFRGLVNWFNVIYRLAAIIKESSHIVFVIKYESSSLVLIVDNRSVLFQLQLV